ncbi:MAG: hypothetical protein IJ220_06480 [Clostridia bacterium]|nr:hypothetical protein [Clostridia bacterium]
MDNLLSKWKEGSSKKQIENVVIFIILLIIVIIVINSLFSEEKNVTQKIESQEIINNTVNSDELESKLQKILSSINGVGNVEVMISYSNTVTQIPMFNTKENTTTIEEQDVNGGKRKTEEISNEQSIIFEEKNSTKIPALKQTMMPEVIGVIVVAEGANNQVVKENIKNAVQAVVNIASHHIQVFAK